jgi:hypothetical protein
MLTIPAVLCILGWLIHRVISIALLISKTLLPFLRKNMQYWCCFSSSNFRRPNFGMGEAPPLQPVLAPQHPQPLANRKAAPTTWGCHRRKRSKSVSGTDEGLAAPSKVRCCIEHIIRSAGKRQRRALDITATYHLFSNQISQPLGAVGATAALSLAKSISPFPWVLVIMRNGNIYLRLVLSCGTVLE